MDINRRNYLAAAGGALTATAIAAAAGAEPQGGQPPGKDIRVINKPSEAVPVSIQGAAQIDTSSPIPVRDVDRKMQQPVQFYMSRSKDGETNYIVPDAKRLVIEYVSGSASVDIGTLTSAKVTTSISGDEQSHSLNVTLTGPNGPFQNYQFGQLVRIYADPSSIVSAHISGVHDGNGVVDARVFMTVSGYLEDIQ